jgi:hypothetical protein
LLEAKIQSIANVVAKILTEKKPNCDCVRLSVQVFVARCAFDGRTDTKNVLGGNRWIQRNGVPIGKSVSCFDRRTRFLRVTAD